MILWITITLALSGVYIVRGVDVRLVGGKSNLEGRVEVFYNNTWGTVCDDDFDDHDAKVFCHMLGYDRNGATAVTAGYYGPGGGPILLDDLNCNGTESSVEECIKPNAWGINDCTNLEDAGIICRPSIRLADGMSEYDGRIEVKYSNNWGTVCDIGFSILDAQVFCHMLGYERFGAEVFRNAYFGRGSGPVWLNNLTCFGNETSVADCVSSTWGTNNCDHSKDAGIQCVPKIDFRLRGGQTEYEGRVEIYFRQTWGTLCGRNIGASEAQVLCHMLGFPREDAVVFRNAYFGRGIGSIWLEDLDCDGQEPNILRCRNSSFVSNNCGHSEDAGVRCKPRVRLIGGPSAYEGRLEIFHSDEWGTVCDDEFDGKEAQVFCHMLGYERNGSVNYYAPGNGIIWLDELKCTGTENSIDDCDKLGLIWGVSDCYHNEDIGIKCRPKSSCPGLAAITNGQYSNSSCTLPTVPVDSTCDLICNSGFEISSFQNTTCLGTGLWDVPDHFLTCEGNTECIVNPCDQICRYTTGMYECSCNDGYYLDQDNKTCIDVNECAVSNGGCHQICQNENGTFSCGCFSGYFLQENNVTCEDVDECTFANRSCEQGCTNRNGSFSCFCFGGYSLQNDNRSCVDINECDINNGGCEHVCSNKNGTHSCFCKEGYSLENDTLSCKDIDECQVNNGGCLEKCYNFAGNFSCDCDKGFVYENDTHTCIDVDECETNTDWCDQLCYNNIGSYYCECEKGFGLNSNNMTCDDFVECEINNGGCQQTCINFQGSFLCSCEMGYVLNKNGSTCENVSEHSVSSSLIFMFDYQIVNILLDAATYNSVVENITVSLQKFFKTYTSLPFYIVLQKIREYRQDNNTRVLVNYTIIYDKDVNPSIRDSLIRGILAFNVTRTLDYNGEHVLAYIVNQAPTISPIFLVANVSENTVSQTVVGEFTVHDSDADVRGEMNVYSDDKPEEVRIGPIINGKVQLLIVGLLDADKYKSTGKQGILGPVINFTIVVKDKPGLTAKAYISLTVIDVNDNGPRCSPSKVTVKIPRDSNNGSEILNLDTVCSDDDYFYNRLSYTMKEDNCTVFGIDKPSLLSLKSHILDTMISCLVSVYVADVDNKLFNTTLTVIIKFLECPAGTDYLNNDWKRGIPGKYTSGACPEGYKGEVKRFCGKDGIYQEPFYNCTSTEIAEIFEKVLKENVSTSEVLDDLVNVTATTNVKNKTLLIGDLEAVNQVMAKITEIIEVKPENVARVTDSFVETANNILDESTTTSWTSKMNQTGSGADKVLENLDRFVEKIANVSTSKGELKVSKSNLFLTVGSTDGCVNIKFPNRSAGDVPDWAENTADNVQVACEQTTKSYSSVLYRNLSQILPSTLVNRSDTKKKLNAPVLSFTYFPKTERKLDTPIEITFQLYNGSLENPSCSFWSKNNSSAGAWSSEGCWLYRFSKDTKTIVCKCDHLTNFAVLMSPSKLTSEAHDVALSVISMVGCILSMVCLVLTVAVHGFFWRAVKSEKTILNMNLSGVLFVAYLLFLSGVDQTENEAACTAIAVLLHLVFLVVFFIMLGEGLLLANTVLFPFSSRRIGIHLLIGAYALAVVIVAISMGSVQLDGYGGSKSCWLSTSSGLIWAFLVPVLVVIVANLTIVILVIRKMFTTAAMSKKTDKEKARAGVRSIVILMPIMGITWVFGIFSVNKDTLVFQYLFALFNSIQGVLIFVFYCAMNRKIQLAFRKQVSKWQTLHSYDITHSTVHSTGHSTVHSTGHSTKSTKVTEESTSAI